MVCSNPKFETGHNFLFSGKYHVKNRLFILTRHLKGLSLSF